VASLSGEITTQYVIRYNADIAGKTEARQFRRVRVAVDLPGVQVRARSGYYPNAVPGTQ
jgi:hypothetical protein